MAGRKRFDKTTRVRLTNDEYKRLKEFSRIAGTSLSRYLVESTLDEKGTKSANRHSTEADRYQRDWAINEVARVGNNINQIARQLNSQHGSITIEAVEKALRAAVKSINDLRELWAKADESE